MGRRKCHVIAAAVAWLGLWFSSEAHAYPGRMGIVGAANLGQLAVDGVPGSLSIDFGGVVVTSTREEQFAPGWEVGGVFEWPREGRFRLETGARYVVQPGDTEFSSEGLSAPAEDNDLTRLEYAVAPIQLLFSPFSTHRLRLTAGVNVGYLLRASSKTEIGEFTNPASSPQIAFASIFESFRLGEWHETTSEYERWNTELSAGAGWEFGGDQPAVRFDLRYAYGLTDISKSEAEYHTRRVTFSIATLW